MKIQHRSIVAFAAIPFFVAGCGGFSGSTAPAGPKVISLWTTTSTPDGSEYKQVDRLARPAVNEVFATVAGNQHEINDLAIPTEDATNLGPEIVDFMTNTAGRSPAIANFVKSVLVPDVLKFDLNSNDAASYLGFETGGATGGKFGGRKLDDDVIDISLGVIFGGTVPALGLAAEDGKEIPTLTSDHVDASGKHFTSTFPYIGRPN